MSQLNFTIQEAQKKDAPALINYVKRVADETNFLTFDSSEFNKTIEEEAQIIESHRLAKNQLFILAKLDHQIIGMLNVNANRKKRLAHIGEFGVSVLQAYWNKGVGGSLVDYMIDWAIKSGVIRKLNLTVSADNESAIQLYKNKGFEMEGRISRDIQLDGVFYDTFKMGLLID